MDDWISTTDLQGLRFYPFLPNTELFESLRWAASEKRPSKAVNLGFIGHDGRCAYFRMHCESEKFRLELDEVREGTERCAHRSYRGHIPVAR